ncbi:MAG: hypothetical protein LWW77_05595 [Propionibacteriales bacterium]|nr:hypothetical protein [Propionibacteriales bacterium]
MTTPTTRRWPLWTSAAILAATAAIHIFAGTPEYLPAVDASGLSGQARGLAIALWHLTSVLLVLLPVALAWAGRANDATGRPLVVGVWLVCVAFVVIMLGIDLLSGGVVSPLVQWTLFVPGVILLPFVRLTRS